MYPGQGASRHAEQRLGLGGGDTTRGCMDTCQGCGACKNGAKRCEVCHEESPRPGRGGGGVRPGRF